MPKQQLYTPQQAQAIQAQQTEPSAQDYKDFLNWKDEQARAQTQAQQDVTNQQYVDNVHANAPIPQSDLDAFLADRAQKSIAQGKSPAEVAQEEAQIRDEHGKHLGDYVGQAAMAGADGFMRGADYLDGLGRTAAMTPFGATSSEDWKKAAVGKATPGEELLRRAGRSIGPRLEDMLPEGFSDFMGAAPAGNNLDLTVRRGALGDLHRRDLEGFGLELATSPAVWASGPLKAGYAGLKDMLGKAVSKVTDTQAAELAGKLASKVPLLVPASKAAAWTGKNAANFAGHTFIGDPLGAFTEDAGKRIYRSGFTRPDQENAKYGKAPVSDEFLNDGFVGGNDAAVEHAEKMIEQIEQGEGGRAHKMMTADLANRTLDQGWINVPRNGERWEQQGVGPSLNRALQGTRDWVSKFAANNPHMQELIPAMNDYINEMMQFGEKHPPGVTEMLDWRSGLYDIIGREKYAKFAESGDFKDFLKKVAQGMTEESINGANRISVASGMLAKDGSQRMLGDEIAADNLRLAKYLTAQRALESDAQREGRKAFWTKVDPMVAAFGMIGGNPASTKVGAEVGLGALLAKKLTDMGHTTWGKTHVGKALVDFGRSPLPDALIRRPLINEYRGSPWDSLGRDASGVLPRPNKPKNQ